MRRSWLIGCKPSSDPHLRGKTPGRSSASTKETTRGVFRGAETGLHQRRRSRFMLSNPGGKSLARFPVCNKQQESVAQALEPLWSNHHPFRRSPCTGAIRGPSRRSPLPTLGIGFSNRCARPISDAFKSNRSEANRSGRSSRPSSDKPASLKARDGCDRCAAS